MKIKITYKNGINTEIECEKIAVGPGGILWESKNNSGFLGFDPENWEVEILESVK